MLRFVALAALAWGLLSCQPELLLPDPSAGPRTLPAPSISPGRPDPTIEIPPPI